MGLPRNQRDAGNDREAPSEGAGTNETVGTSAYKVIFRLTTVLLLVAAVTVGVTMLLIGIVRAAGTAQIVWISIGTSLLATTLFSVLQSLLQTASLLRYERSVISDTANEEIRQFSGQLSKFELRIREELVRLRQDFVPTRDYLPSAEPNAELNRDITADMRTSPNYVFTGLTGIFAAGRLNVVRVNQLQDVQLILADPTAKEAIRKRIQLEARRPEGLDRTLQQAYTALVALCDLKSKYARFEVYLREPTFNRVELFRAHTYLTLFGASTELARFPRTVCFSEDSAFYRSLLQELGHLTAQSKQIAFPDECDDTSIANWFTEQFEVGITESQVAAYRHDFKQYCESTVRPALADARNG